jgi:CheY-like chemotaxis protein
MVLLDIHLKGDLNGIDLAKKLTKMNLAFVYLTANFQGKLLEEAKSTMPYGFIVKPFREDDLLTTLDVAFYRHQNSIESSRLQEMELNLKLKDIRNYLGNEKEKLAKVSDVLQAHIPFDYLNFVFKKNGETEVRAIGFLRIGFEEYQVLEEQELLTITGIDRKKLRMIYGSQLVVNKSKYFNEEDFDLLCNDSPMSKLIADTYDFDSALLIPIVPANSDLIRYEFYNRKGNTYSQLHVNLLTGLVNVMGNVAEPTLEQVPVSGKSARS